MLGAVAGDMIGSPYEFYNVKSKDFDLVTPHTTFTDDTVMTLANAKWLVEDPDHTPEYLVKCMRELGLRFHYAGYGGNFNYWLHLPEEQVKPYNSWGNGAGMRVSPVGMYAKTMGECFRLAKISAEVTHNHPEGIKGAQAIALSVFLARHSDDVFSTATKSIVKDLIQRFFGYDLNFTLDEIRPDYDFDVSCQGSCPQAIRAYLEASDFEDAIRNAVSIGGDSDTIAAMAGGIAGAKGVPPALSALLKDRLDPYLLGIMEAFELSVAHPEPVK